MQDLNEARAKTLEKLSQENEMLREEFNAVSVELEQAYAVLRKAEVDLVSCKNSERLQETCFSLWNVTIRSSSIKRLRGYQ